ncbi:MAG: FAD:protein FMN transferase [Kofleriaceae bacterium]
MWTFTAMNTEVAVAAPGLAETAAHALAGEVGDLFAAAEARFSRFRPDSELARLNRAGGPTVVSPALFDALVDARAHVAATGGLFDPTIGAALCAAGYDRSRVAGPLDRPDAPGPPPPVSFGAVTLDPATRSVARPPGVVLDLGGMIKGRTVDAAVRLLADRGADLALVDAGGDAALVGAGPTGDGWRIDVEDPAQPARTLLTLIVRDRAVATSGTNRRRWHVGGVVAHHLIDPRTARPSTSALAQVTVLAPTVEQADVLAKAALLAGADAGARLLGSFPAVAAVLVAHDGELHRVGALEVDHG